MCSQRCTPAVGLTRQGCRGGGVAGSRKADKLDKMAEYADAGIPFYWLAWLSDDHVLQIDIHVLDHTLGSYTLFRTLTPEQETCTVEVPVRIQVEWSRLAHLVRS
jgi:hypothetical protein